ncbi:MAG: glycosyltransferase family 9 protein [Armatimonadota bacterium]
MAENIRQVYPDAEICSVVRSNLAALAARAVPIDTVETRPDGILAYPEFVGRLRRRKADLAVVISTSTVSMMLSRASGARRVVAFDKDWAKILVRERVKSVGPPSLKNNMRLAAYFNPDVPKRDYRGLLRVRQQDREAADELLLQAGLGAGEKIAAIAPLASPLRRWKCWPRERFSTLVERLYKQTGIIPALVGTAPEREEIAGIVEGTGCPAVNLAGKTDTAAVLGLLDRAEVLIGLDSGLAHLSGALGSATVAIFGPTDPDLTGPIGANTTVVYAGLECSPCHRRAARCWHRDCLMEISVDEVLDKTLSVMHDSRAPQGAATVE